ncbi:putative lipid II flippase FtsW [Sutcliffiella horikoshii]|uniref:putative lipid II flippase FtsW n=1 Tax=Sutcliffiella horikoshii TaxID=79883 RepID=UPI002041E1DD|nr:putative lipid II flippase FtsW [Sutcliffiella horikoshii]MCM3618994.1 putative lipid II flippase FtsW [Sutcliffiella horikoshii]
MIHFKKLDWILITAIVLLCTYGLIMVYSAGMLLGYEQYEDYAYFFNKQKDWLILGIPVFIGATMLKYKFYDKFTPLFVGVIILMLLAVLIPFIGVDVNGSRRWIDLGFRIQPSEIAKLVMVIYFARVYARKQPYIHQFKQGVAPPLAVLVLVFFLILLQPDLGTGTSILIACGAILICSGAKLKHILMLGTVAAGAVIILATTATYRLQRITSFIDPFGNESDTGFQLVNSFIAIGDAGLTGRGLGQGIHKLGYLPEAHTDFILAVISEELGIFGVLFLFLLYLIVLLRGVRIGVALKDPFGKLLAFGITFQISSQVFFNAGAVSGLLPITGITLPFISYGGSSLLITIYAAGILVHLSKHATIAREAREETESTWGQKITS